MVNNLEHIYTSDIIFTNPVDITVSRNNEIFLTESAAVHRLDINGLVITKSSELFGDDYQYDWGTPSGICCVDNLVYVADSNKHVLVILDRNLNYVNHFGTYGTFGSSNDKLYGPLGVCTDGIYIYIADALNNRIMKLTKSLDYVSKSIAISLPCGIEYIRGENKFLVSQLTLDKVIKFDYYLSNIINSVGATGTGDGEFDTPKYIAIDNQNFYVADSNNDRIQVFDLGMSFVDEVGEYGTEYDEYDTPSGIYCHKSFLLITDANNRVNIITNYKTSRLREPLEAQAIDEGDLLLGGGQIIIQDDDYVPTPSFVIDEKPDHSTAWRKK